MSELFIRSEFLDIIERDGSAVIDAVDLSFNGTSPFFPVTIPCHLVERWWSYEERHEIDASDIEEMISSIWDFENWLNGRYVFSGSVDGTSGGSEHLKIENTGLYIFHLDGEYAVSSLGQVADKSGMIRCIYEDVVSGLDRLELVRWLKAAGM